MSASCGDVELLIGRPRSALSEADRLQLEQHLSECAVCTRASALSRSITTLVSAAPSSLGSAARERAIAAAFVASRRSAEASARRPAPSRFRLVAGLTAAALVLLGVRLLWPASAPVELAQTSQAVAPAAPEARAVEPAVQVAAHEEGAWFEAAQGELRSFAHAQVTLAAGTRVRFDAASVVLELAQGQVEVDVDASRGQAFAVQTQFFRAQVLGTMFAVTPERVDVSRGHVQVQARDGSFGTADLGPGQSFSLAQARAAARVSKRPLGRAGEETAGAKRERAATLLLQARSSLAHADVAAARALIARAEQLPLKRRERAEAGTLRAECALLERKPAEAVQAYLAVADDYAELAAGENALFAAAQLSARSAPAAPGTHALLARYLARYPQGRFSDEVRSRLAKASAR